MLAISVGSVHDAVAGGDGHQCLRWCFTVILASEGSVAAAFTAKSAVALFRRPEAATLRRRMHVQHAVGFPLTSFRVPHDSDVGESITCFNFGGRKFGNKDVVKKPNLFKGFVPL